MAIYFLKFPPTGDIKIGYSVNPIERIRNQNNIPTKLEILAIALDGTKISDSYLLKKFAKFQVAETAEWFTPNPELNEIVDYVKEHRNLPNNVPKYEEIPASELQYYPKDMLRLSCDLCNNKGLGFRLKNVGLCEVCHFVVVNYPTLRFQKSRLNDSLYKIIRDNNLPNKNYPT